MTQPVKLRFGDIGLSYSPSLVARGIIWAQRLIDRFRDPVPYSHAFIVTPNTALVVESARHIGCDFLRKYLGKQVLLARPNPKITFDEAHLGFSAIEKLHGRNYPVYRLALFLLGWADNLAFSDSLVCSELVAKFLINSGHPEFEDFRGVMPDDIEDLIRAKYEVIFEGIMTESDFMKLIGATE